MDGSVLDGLGCDDFCHEWICGNDDVYRCSREGCTVNMAAEAVGKQAGERDLDLVYLELEARRK